MTAPRMIYSGRCDVCSALILFGSDDQTDETVAKEISDTWPGNYEDGGFSPDCIACDGNITWNGSDPTRSVLR